MYTHTDIKNQIKISAYQNKTKSKTERNQNKYITSQVYIKVQVQVNI